MNSGYQRPHPKNNNNSHFALCNKGRKGRVQGSGRKPSCFARICARRASWWLRPPRERCRCCGWCVATARPCALASCCAGTRPLGRRGPLRTGTRTGRTQRVRGSLLRAHHQEEKMITRPRARACSPRLHERTMRRASDSVAPANPQKTRGCWANVFDGWLPIAKLDRRRARRCVLLRRAFATKTLRFQSINHRLGNYLSAKLVHFCAQT